MVAVQKWLSEVLDLEVKLVFPCTLGGNENLEFISQLVNGFALQLGKTRLVFIPSQSSDLTEIEIPQEWVDLPSWMGDYYVPIQVDVEGKYLHLWTFISHYDLKNNGEFERVFRNYEVADGSKNLDILFTACELHLLGELIPKRGKIDPVQTLSSDVNKLIEQLKQHRSGFSPRLKLPFSQWGAILNDRQHLENYLNPPSVPNELERLGREFTRYIDSLISDGWQLLNNYLYPPQRVPHLALPTLPIKVKLEAVKGLSLKSSEGIKTAVTKVYQQQNDIPLPKEIIGIKNLIPVLINCKDDKVWWQAAEYLWAIEPDLFPSVAVIRELETQFADRKIVLMIATIKTPHNRFAVLVRLYPAAGNTYLPPRLQLSVRDKKGVNFLIDSHGKPIVVTVRTDIKDSSIQLYFGADYGDRFSACISIDSIEVIEDFPLPQFHSI